MSDSMNELSVVRDDGTCEVKLDALLSKKWSGRW